MASVNKVILIGNLGQDPSTRYLPNGDAVTNITVATTETWKDKNGEKVEKTEWHRCTFYRKLAEIAGEYLKKGSQVYLEGRLETKKWTDKQGIERYSTDVIVNEMKMLGSKPSGNREREEKKFEGGAATGAPKSDFSDMSDDIPFLINELYSVPAAVSRAFMRARRAR